MNDLPIIIAGGGIGGLAMAMGLAQKGFPSLVLERSAQFGEIGAGIQLGPNAFHAFDYLGVGDQARKMAVYIDNLRLMDAMSGSEIANIPLNGKFLERFNNPYAVVHRGDLHRVFLDACIAHDLVDLRTNSTVIGYEQNGTSATAILDNEQRVKGKALIGADGLWSNIRNQLIGDGPPRVSGHTTYRSVISYDQMPEDLRWNAATLWAGPRCHIVHYPLSDGKQFNLVVTYHNDAPEPVAGKPVTHEEVRRGFEHIHPVAKQIIECGKDWKMWVLCDREPADDWVDNNVTLLGDAAHPTLQYLAQGACMAMEDAVCLADQIEKSDGRVDIAMKQYQELRYMRTVQSSTDVPCNW